MTLKSFVGEESMTQAESNNYIQRNDGPQSVGTSCNGPTELSHSKRTKKRDVKRPKMSAQCRHNMRPSVDTYSSTALRNPSLNPDR